jgi:hypothetical protein
VPALASECSVLISAPSHLDPSDDLRVALGMYLPLSRHLFLSNSLELVKYSTAFITHCISLNRVICSPQLTILRQLTLSLTSALPIGSKLGVLLKQIVFPHHIQWVLLSWIDARHQSWLLLLACE